MIEKHYIYASPWELKMINSSIPQNKIRKGKQLFNAIKLRYIKILHSHKIHLHTYITKYYCGKTETLHVL